MTVRKRRRITSIFFFLSGILTASWSLRIPDVQNKLELNNAALGSVLAALPAGMIMALAFSGWAVTVFGTRKVIAVSCVMVAALLCCLGLADSRWQLMVLLFLTGLFRTFLNIGMNSNAIEIQEHYTKPVISSFHGIWSAACLLASGISAAMIFYSVTVDIHFMAVALPSAAVAVVLHLWSKSSVHVLPEKRPFFVKPDRYLWLLGIVLFCAMSAENAMLDWSVNYFEKTLKVRNEQVTIGYTSGIITMTLGRLFGDRLVQRHGAIKMLVINGLIIALGFSLAAAFPFLLPAAAGFLLVGLGDSIIVPIVYVLASRQKNMPPAYAITSVTLIGYFGFLTAPLFIGGISELFGMRWALVFVAALASCISLLSLSIRSHLPGRI
jgi:MFS family permease